TYIICASAAGRKAYSADNDSKYGSPVPEHEIVQGDTFHHLEFSFHFLNALRGKVPWPPGSSDSLHPARADYNHDGNVSWEEAFIYADSFDSQQDKPVMHTPSSFWRVLSSIPGTKKARVGTAIASVPMTVGNETLEVLFVLKGKTNEFWAYYPDCDSWAAKETLPWELSGRKKKWDNGATLVAGQDGKLYATRGRCLEFWCYDPGTGVWELMPSVPYGPSGKVLKYGTATAAVTIGDTSYIYLVKGTKTREMYRLCIPYNSSHTWEVLADVPPGPNNRPLRQGSCMAWDRGDTIFLLKGYYNEFWAYSLSTSTWHQRAYLPYWSSRGSTGKAKDGSGMVVIGDKVYVLRGKSDPPEVWCYLQDLNGWSPLPAMVAGPSGQTRCDGGMTSAEGFLWVLRGKNSNDFYRLTPKRYIQLEPSPQPEPTPSPCEIPVVLGVDLGGPRWSPSVEWVVFSRPDSNGNLQIWMAQTDSNDERQLTSLSGDCEYPVWSPDESRIAFQFTPLTSPYSQIGVVDTSGMVSFLTTDSCDKEYPDWSPDGALIAYQADDTSGFTQIYTISANDGARTQWTSEPVDHEKPKFSSTGSIIYQREGTNGFSQIYRLDLSSAQENQLTFSDADHENPAVAVDAGLVVFEVSDANGFSQIGIVSVGGGAEQILTSGEYDFTDPSISDDGATIHCVRWGTTGSAICLVNSDGGYELLTDDEVDRENPHTTSVVAFSPAAIYVRPDGVYRTGIQQRSGSQSAGGTAINLGQALPNPARERVRIKYSLPEETEINLKVYNSAGQLMRTLVSGRAKPGQYSTVWDGKDTKGERAGAGVYFYQLETEGRRLSQKLVLTE
ncbi:MAG: FlgD immunoglobulin-like domain containing protein, partial [candidate division WOR-3 bacterium]